MNRLPDPVVGGHTLKRQGDPSAGMIFYNYQGDECGGLSFDGGNKNENYQASAGLMFDQYHQDQIVGLMYGDENGRREYGLHVWARPNAPGWTQEGKIGSHHRMFVGRNSNDETIILMRDSKGQTRIRMKIDADDVPRLEFLNEKGEVVYSLPPEDAQGETNQ